VLSDHYEKRTRRVRDSKGHWHTQTYTVRVNTSSASTSGSLASEDVSPTFVPFRGRRDVVIKSEENVALHPSFVSAYNSRRALFYRANRRDTHQDQYLLRAIMIPKWLFLTAVFRPLRTVFRGLGAGFWNLGGQTEKMAKKREKTGEKWARNGLKKVGPMTE